MFGELLLNGFQWKFRRVAAKNANLTKGACDRPNLIWSSVFLASRTVAYNMGSPDHQKDAQHILTQDSNP